MKLALALAAAGCGAAHAPERPIPVVDPPVVASAAPQPSSSAAVVIVPARPKNMVLVPAGPFPRGCVKGDEQCYGNEKPGASVELAGFYLDRTEVTVADYRRCVEAGACGMTALDRTTVANNGVKPPHGGSNGSEWLDDRVEPTCNWLRYNHDDHPMNCVSWDQAAAYCRSVGKRLPSEAEWEKAARGDEPRIYPWGSEPPSCARVVMNDGSYGCGELGTMTVGARSEGKSPYGAVDLVGNVWEWTADWYGDGYYATAPRSNPRGPEIGETRVVKGGGWSDAVRGDINPLRISNRFSYPPGWRFPHTGFRCARSVTDEAAGPAATSAAR